MSVSSRVFAGAGYNDGNFTNYTWTAVEIQDTTDGQTGGFTAGEVPTGGVAGGAYRSNSFSFDSSGSPFNQGILIGNTNSAMVYSPAISGPINSITFSIAASLLSSSFVDTGLLSPQDSRAEPKIKAPLTVQVGLLLLQNGLYYTNQLQNPTGFGFPIKEFTPQLASDFTQVGSLEPANPDFTASGAPIQFGYVIAASYASSSPATITGAVGVDQFFLSIDNTPMPQFISEQPANAASMAVTLTGLAFGENITWLVSTDLLSWSTNFPSPTSTAADTNGTFTITNFVNPAARVWFLRALVQ